MHKKFEFVEYCPLTGEYFKCEWMVKSYKNLLKGGADFAKN